MKRIGYYLLAIGCCASGALLWWSLALRSAYAQANDLADPQFIARLIPSSSASSNPSDDFESYSDGVAVNGLNGGLNWNGPYVDRAGYFGVQSSDDFESYTDAASVNGLSAGNGWNGSYVDRTGVLGVQASDDLESYSDGASVNGLNGGTGWGGSFVDR